MEEKGFWRKFNPTIKDMMEQHPNYSVLGLWWSFTWRLFVIQAAIGFCFFLFFILFIVAALFGHHS